MNLLPLGASLAMNLVKSVTGGSAKAAAGPATTGSAAAGSTTRLG